VLTLDGVSVDYGRKPALSDLSLHVDAGEIVSIIGANGAGKSTTLMSVAGAVRIRLGAIQFEDVPIHNLAPEKVVRLGVSLVPERRRIFSTLTVAENLSLASLSRRRSGDVKVAIAEVQDRFPVLRTYINTPAGRLSGGEQQQLAIGRALMSRPRLLMLDEPSLGLAPMLVKRVFETLEELRRDGVTILLVEQFAQRAISISDRAYVLRSGRLVKTLSSREGKSDELEEAYFGSPSSPGGRSK
jgi:branched-chain amino acid transport system ATP-binding protein